MDGVDSQPRVGISVSEWHWRYAQAQDRLAQEKASAARAAEEKQRALASMLITSGFNFDGYKITKYSGYISGDDAVSMIVQRRGGLGE